MKLRTLLASAGAAIAMGLASPAWAGYLLSVSPSASSGLVGEHVSVTVNLSLGAGEQVDSVGFALAYDPGALEYAGGTFGSLNDPLDDWFTSITAPPAAGRVDVSALSLSFTGPWIVGDTTGSLAVFDFLLTSASPSSALTLIDDQSRVVSFAFAELPHTVQNASIDVLAVPTPASLPLVGLALFLLGWTRRAKLGIR
jgi:hypothetical protein